MATARPVGTSARPPPAGEHRRPRGRGGRARRRPVWAYAGRGRSGSSRTTGTSSTPRLGARPGRPRRAARWPGTPGRRRVVSSRVLVWMDLEMTGLDPAKDVIVEIATLVTDDDLQIVAEGPDLVVHQSDEALGEMDPVVVDMHTKSGLLAGDQGLDDHARGGRARRRSSSSRQHVPVPADGAAVRQLDRHGPALPRRLPAGDRGVAALPLGRRVEREGARPALVPRGRRQAAVQGRPATGPSTTSARASTSCSTTASGSSCPRRTAGSAGAEHSNGVAETGVHSAPRRRSSSTAPTVQMVRVASATCGRH